MKIKVKSQQIMYKRDGVVRLSVHSPKVRNKCPQRPCTSHRHFTSWNLWFGSDSIGTIHVTGKFSAKDNWSEMLILGKLASRLIRGKNSVNSTIGRKSLSELTEDQTYPRSVVLKTINIIGTVAFCPSWAKIRLMRVRLIRGLL